MKRKLAFLFLAGAAGLMAQQSVRSAITDPVTAAWTSATTSGASGATVELATNGYNTALVALHQTGTLSFGVVTFEASDTAGPTPTNIFYPVPCLGPTTNSSTLGVTSSTDVAVQCNATGYKRFQVRLSTGIGGSGTVNVAVQLASSGGPSGYGGTGALLGKVAIDQTTPGTTNLVYTYNGDPCSDPAQTKTWTPFSQAATGPATILTGVSAKKWYVCGILVTNGVSTGAINVNFVEGTGTNCSSVSAGLFGGTSAAAGASVAASGGYAFGNGAATVAVTATAADHVCFIASTTTQVSGVIVAVNK